MCNQNPIITNSSIEFSKKLLQESNISNLSCRESGFLRYFISSSMKASNASDKILKSYGLSFENFVIGCEFNSQQCGIDDFDW